MRKTSGNKLTETEWRQVFHIRCRTKRGETVSHDDRALCDRAFESDVKRYAAMDPGVFNATVPFGTDVRWPDVRRPLGKIRKRKARQP